MVKYPGVTSNHYHGARCLEGVSNTGDSISYPWTGGHYTDPRVTGYLGPPFGCMGRHLFMPEIY